MSTELRIDSTEKANQELQNPGPYSLIISQ